MANTEKKKFQFKMPHTYVILVSIMVLMLVLTHIIPAGQYDRVEDPVSGKMVVVDGTYHEIDVEAPGIFDLFLALQQGYVESANIMFLIIFSYGFVYVLTKNGTMDKALGTMVRKVGKRVQLLIPITMLVLGILGSTMGIYEEVYGLFPVFVGIFMALGYDAIVGGAIPKEYIPAVDAGIQGAMNAGVVAGFPVVDVKVTLYDGSYHEVDSSEMAFKIAGSMAFKEACRKADPTLLEPIMKVSVIVPDEYMGDVIGDLNSRRGQIQGQESRPGATQIDALVPLANMFGYATDLRSSTQGRGQYSMEPHSYVEIPKSIADKIIAERGRNQE